jgi:ATP-dependent 26S proteasome regulatory subunit
MATNRADTLDPALLRPGRLDRKIEFPLPDRRQKRLVFQVITSKMNLSEEVDLEDCMYRAFAPSPPATGVCPIALLTPHWGVVA